jgi:hypothetical protein
MLNRNGGKSREGEERTSLLPNPRKQDENKSVTQYSPVSRFNRHFLIYQLSSLLENKMTPSGLYVTTSEYLDELALWIRDQRVGKFFLFGMTG